MSTSFLINERIALRAVEPLDIDIMYQMENDSSLWDISNLTVPYSRYLLQQYIENNQYDVFADKQLRLMIVNRQTGVTIGTIDLTDYSPLHAHAEVGIAIHRSYRNEGYGKDALNLICDYAFKFLHMHQLHAHIAIENKVSIALFESCGFQSCGLLKEWLHLPSGYMDVILMQRLNTK